MHFPNIVRFLCAATIASAGLSTEAAPVLLFDPSAQFVSSGQDFTLDVSVNGAVDLYAWQFNFRFDPGVLQVVSVVEGSLSALTGASLFIEGTIDSQLGTVTGTLGTLLGPRAGLSGDGVLATIKFIALAVGQSDIKLADTLLLDSTLTELPAAVQDGVVTVTGGGGVVPEPTSAWLCLTALAALATIRRRTRAQGAWRPVPEN